MVTRTRLNVKFTRTLPVFFLLLLSVEMLALLNVLVDLLCTIILAVMTHLPLFRAEQTNEQTAELCRYVGVEGSFIHEKTLFGSSVRWSTN